MEILIGEPTTLAESCAFGAAVEEAVATTVLGKFVAVATTVGLPPVEEVVREFDVLIGSPGPISGLPIKTKV